MTFVMSPIESQTLGMPIGAIPVEVAPALQVNAAPAGETIAPEAPTDDERLANHDLVVLYRNATARARSLRSSHLRGAARGSRALANARAAAAMRGITWDDE